MNEFQTVDPSRDEVLKTYKRPSQKEINATLQRLNVGFAQTGDVKTRKKKLLQLGDTLLKNKNELALSITQEMGKPLKNALAEVEKSATASLYYGENLERFLQTEKVPGDKKSYEVWIQPTGTLFAIMPWNFPIWQIMRVLPAAMGIGNPVLLKHSDQTAGTAKMFNDIVQSVWGENMFQALFLDHEQSARVIQDPSVRSVTMTGSSRGGREVAALAGGALKKVVLELGGSDVYLVFEDSDLQKAAALCAQTRLINNGQSCVSGKRFVVEKTVFDTFVALFVEEMKKPVIGDPRLMTTDLGPLAHMRFFDGLQKQTVRLAKAGGKKLFERRLQLEGDLKKGAFFGPQAWRVKGDEKIVREEEFFGPVALLMSFEDEDEAVRLANGSVYGLGAGVFSGSRERCLRVADRLQAGFVAVNDFVRSDARVPFGGVKDSGFGRELGPHGFREFVNFKTFSG